MRFFKRKKLPKILYCATSLWLRSPDDTGFLGEEIYLSGETQVPAIRSVLNVLKDFKAELYIKPHSHEGEPLWRGLMKESPKGLYRIKLGTHRDNMFKLMMQSRAMICPYISAALIETGMIGLPTFLLNLDGRVENNHVRLFEKLGFLKIIRTEGQLRWEIKALQLQAWKRWPVPR